MQIASLCAIARRVRNPSGAILCFAGTPVCKAVPGGMMEILRASGSSSPLPSAGLTQIKSAAAFTAPTFQTNTTSRREGYRVDHFATVLSTTSRDATHDSYFPAAGLHQQPPAPGSHSRAPKFWEITVQLSDLIRRGEQEHLDDARLAYELTYKRVEDEINRLVGRQFGPASTPDAATQMALNELGRRLPAQLGTNPANWPRVLDALLRLSKTRDTNLMHSIELDAIREEGGKTIERLRPSTFFRVGQVPSSQIVRF